MSAYNYLFKSKKQFLPYYFYEELPTATQVKGTEKYHISASLCGGKLFLDKFLLLISKAFINPLFLSEHRAGKRHYIIMKVDKKYLGQNPRQTPPFVPPTKSHSVLPLPKGNKDRVTQLSAPPCWLHAFCLPASLPTTPLILASLHPFITSLFLCFSSPHILVFPSPVASSCQSAWAS